MSTNYVQSNQRGNLFANCLLGLAATLAIFLLLPLLHYLESVAKTKSNITIATTTELPPPPPPTDLPPPPKQTKDLDKPEMEEPPPPMTLDQLEMALNPGSGDAVGDFGFGDMGGDIDTLGDMKIFDLSEVDQQPQVIVMPEPVYPYQLQQSKTSGSCTVEFVLDDKGKIQRARAVKSTNRLFEQPAIDAVMRAKIKPARKDGKPVTCRVRIPIEFNI